MDNKAVVERMWAAMESDDFEAFEDLIHPDGIDFRGIGAQLTTARVMREFVEAYKAGFPDLGHEVVDSIESGDTIALELRVTGTHTGTPRGPSGEIPATGRPVVWESLDYVKVRDGKVTSWHVYNDQLAFLVQLGVMPDPASHAA